MNDAPNRSALPGLPPLPATWRRDCLWIALLFLGTRAAVLAVFWLRGRDFPFMDAAGYVGQAAWLAAHGSLVIPDADGARFFHGMPLLVSLAGRLTGEFLWTGLLVNTAAGLGAALLFYRNVARLDWSLWQVCLLPGWVSMTATFHSEAGLWCFALLGLTALRLEIPDRPRRLLLVVAGYALACRPTAVFILAPLLAPWLLRSPRAWRTALADGLALGVLPLLLAVWTWTETGRLFPQSAWQAREFAQWSAHYGGGFPTGVFAWPGQSFLAGLASGAVSLPVKLLNLAHLATWAAALLVSFSAWRRRPDDRLAAVIALELAVNGLFILTIGGPFGHTIFYRFLATQANAFVLLALLRHARIPAGLWWAASAASVALASAAARGS
jgi:hypothetical protein